MNQESDVFIERLKNRLPTDHDKMQMIATLMGCSGHIAEYLAKSYDWKKAPIEVKYALALISANMIALISDTPPTIIDKSDDYKMGEQTQERIHRLFKEIIICLYQNLMQEEVE